MSVRRGSQSQERQRLRDGALALAPLPPPATFISAMPPAYGVAMPLATLKAAPTVSTSLLPVDYRSEMETTSPLSSGGRMNDTEFDTEFTDENCTRQFVELVDFFRSTSADDSSGSVFAAYRVDSASSSGACPGSATDAAPDTYYVDR